MVKVLSKHNYREIVVVMENKIQTKEKTNKDKGKQDKEKPKNIKRKPVTVKSKHNPREIVDISKMESQKETEDGNDTKEATWEIKVEEKADKKVTEENLNETEEEQEEDEEEIEINDPGEINRIYRKYLKNPKEPEVGGEEMNLEILLINSLKINMGKLQEITDGFLIDKEYIRVGSKSNVSLGPK